MSRKKALKNNLKIENIIDTLVIFRRSLIFQTKEFFENSTLHGVRYIAESGRPVGEKFMWFCFTTIGAVAALVIISSLWEKFQTNPTITGLDTDFHNQNVVFPTTVVCPINAADSAKAHDVAYKNIANYDEHAANVVTPFLELLTILSFENLNVAEMMVNSMEKKTINEKNLRYWAFQSSIKCENLLLTCKYRDDPIECCAYFKAVYTEHGFCYAFNSRFVSLENVDQKSGAPHDLYETDKKWALFFVPNTTVKIFILPNEEYFGQDFTSQIEWDEGQVVEVRISKKNTYTTEDARQLSISQRKCIFHDEVQLTNFPEDYTFTSCMKQCRIDKAIQFCKCNPPFYKPIQKASMCGIKDFNCLNSHKSNITNIKDCSKCELSCSKTVFSIEKLIKNTDRPEAIGVLVEFLTWPIIRYKREVLFGWVDLLVSFGGIASLFLGFSLLSGVEIIYYFTLRACCMVYKNRQQLYEIEKRIKNEPPPPINMSLKIQKHSLPRPVTVTEDKTQNLSNTVDGEPPSYNEMSGRRRKAGKDYNNFTKTLYKTPKVLPSYTDSLNSKWEYREYLP